MELGHLFKNSLSVFLLRSSVKGSAMVSVTSHSIFRHASTQKEKRVIPSIESPFRKKATFPRNARRLRVTRAGLTGLALNQVTRMGSVWLVKTNRDLLMELCHVKEMILEQPRALPGRHESVFDMRGSSHFSSYLTLLIRVHFEPFLPTEAFPGLSFPSSSCTFCAPLHEVLAWVPCYFVLKVCQCALVSPAPLTFP